MKIQDRIKQGDTISVTIRETIENGVRITPRPIRSNPVQVTSVSASWVTGIDAAGFRRKFNVPCFYFKKKD